MWLSTEILLGKWYEDKKDIVRDEDHKDTDDDKEDPYKNNSRIQIII